MTVVFHNIATRTNDADLLCHKPGTPNVAVPLVKSRLDCSNSSINHVGLYGGKVETKTASLRPLPQVCARVTGHISESHHALALC